MGDSVAFMDSGFAGGSKSGSCVRNLVLFGYISYASW